MPEINLQKFDGFLGVFLEFLNEFPPSIRSMEGHKLVTVPWFILQEHEKFYHMDSWVELFYVISICKNLILALNLTDQFKSWMSLRNNPEL